MKTIKNGSRGPEVKTLQEALNSQSKTSLNVDGIYGPKTEGAVRDFQKKSGLSIDGICGPKTWSRLGFDTADEASSGTRKINKLIMHCTATPEGKDYSRQTISEWHRAEKFSYYINPATGEKEYVGYHYLIHPDGRIEACRPENVRGCHTSGHNSDSIGISYIGGVAADGRTPKDTRTPLQKGAILNLLTELLGRYPGAEIHGHREYAAKACPSFDAAKEYRELEMKMKIKN